MDDGVKDALDYYTRNFSPYQHKQVRILEFPRYQQFAQSFPNTIPFSESIGFIAKVDDKALGAYLEQAGRLRRVGEGWAVSLQVYERGRELLSALDPITLASFRDALGVGRRTAQLLLERYDSDGITRRVGDTRVLRRSG